MQGLSERNSSLFEELKAAEAALLAGGCWGRREGGQWEYVAVDSPSCRLEPQPCTPRAPGNLCIFSLFPCGPAAAKEAKVQADKAVAHNKEEIRVLTEQLEAQVGVL